MSSNLVKYNKQKIYEILNTLIINLSYFVKSDIFKANKLVENFNQILYNIFMPLFEVTNDPSSHPYLHKFLMHVSWMKEKALKNFM